MKESADTNDSQRALDNLVREAGVADLMELYDRIEEVYVAAHGATTSAPRGVITNSTPAITTRR